MLTTERLIKNAEMQWLLPLQEHCREIFKNTHLPSHDETHHTRVWHHARELLLVLSRSGKEFNEKDIEKLIIACFFHDTGMSVSMQKEHGQISRKFAKDYLKNKNLHPDHLEEILDAVENHDKKDYLPENVKKDNKFALQPLLNVSDDLDALGFTGSYRYTEIYLLRNISINEISDLVLGNLQSRFQHMKEYLSVSPAYLKTHNLRYLAARNFFKDLSFQIKQVGDDLSTYNGPIGIVNFIKELLIAQKLHIPDACKNAILIAGDFYVTNFFEKLLKESHVQ